MQNPSELLGKAAWRRWDLKEAQNLREKEREENKQRGQLCQLGVGAGRRRGAWLEENLPRIAVNHQS